MIDVFLSRPNNIGIEEQETLSLIEKILRERDLKLRTIGATDFPNQVPMIAIKNVMKECKGAIIIGFKQIKIEKGINKIGTSNEMELHNKFLPTPWNHIEATMAFVLDLPLLIIRDNEVDGGIFDIGVTNNFIHTFNLATNEWIDEESFLQPFNQWYKEIIKNSIK